MGSSSRRYGVSPATLDQRIAQYYLPLDTGERALAPP